MTTKILDVYFHEKIIGKLEQDKYGEMSFAYAESWLNNPEAIKVSCSLPLKRDPYNRKECRAFFGGILPEENQRKIIAKNLGISANNDFSMLEKIGGECAGALSFIPSGEKYNPNDYRYHKLTNAGLAGILRELPTRPLLAGDQDIRLSLAGVQDKVAIHIENDKISIPLNNAPSTHILKPDFSTYDGVIFNEAFCLTLAKKIGLSVAESQTKKIEDIDFLIIKRYDRIISKTDPKKIVRLHQEDFCQALGIPSTNKYQSDGGPSLKQCFNLVRTESSFPVIDLNKLLSAVIFNFLIGNCDAHGKNFSLLYSKDKLQIAPLYDLICTVYYEELSQKMAMKLGGEYHITRIHLEQFDRLADEIGFAKPEVRKQVFELIEIILSTIPTIETHHRVQEEVAKLIITRCENFIS